MSASAEWDDSAAIRFDVANDRLGWRNASDSVLLQLMDWP